MSEKVKTWSEWLNKTRFENLPEEHKNEMLSELNQIAGNIFSRACLKPEDTFLDVGTGSGLLAFKAYEILKEKGKVIASDAFADCLEDCRQTAKNKGIEDKIDFIQSDATDLKIPDNSIDLVSTRSVLCHVLDKPKIFSEFFRVLKQNGRFSLYEPIMSANSRFYSILNPENYSNFKKIKEVEEKILSDEIHPVFNYDIESLQQNIKKAGFINIDISRAEEFSTANFSKDTFLSWFNETISVGQPSIKEKFLQFVSEKEYEEFIEKLSAAFGEDIYIFSLPKIYIYAEKP